MFQPKRLKRRNLKKFRLDRESNPWPLRYRCRYRRYRRYPSAPVSQRSWVRFPFKPEFFQVSSFQPLRLKHLHCDDLHIILSLSAVQIYEFHILMFSDTFCRLVLNQKRNEMVHFEFQVKLALPTTSSFAKKREWTPYLKNLILAVCRSRQLRNTCVIFNFKS